MVQISNSYDAANLFKALIKYPEQEELFVCSLTAARHVKDFHFVGLGTDAAVCISPKIIAKPAVLDMAAGVIICHTHPSGNPRPSKADIEQTEKLRKALQLFDIELTDHIIIAGDQYFSFVDEAVKNL